MALTGKRLFFSVLEYAAHVGRNIMRHGCDQVIADNETLAYIMTFIALYDEYIHYIVPELGIFGAGLNIIALR